MNAIRLGSSTCFLLAGLAVLTGGKADTGTTRKPDKAEAAHAVVPDYALSYSADGGDNDDLPMGGAGGNSFDDIAGIPWKATVTHIVVRAGLGVDSLRFIWNAKLSSQQHGGSGGNETVVSLSKGEYITGIEGAYSGIVNQIVIETNKRKYGPYGGSTGKWSFHFQAKRGYSIVGLRGRAGMLINQIGPIYQRIPAPSPKKK